jgi:Fe-S-cluster-containing hydrogenase component 2/flavodoxin
VKGIVVYYSGTGNNYKIARAIWRGMKSIIECDEGSLKDINPADMVNYDLIGLGSPIWYFREPAAVRLFIYKMPDMTGKLSFIFTCHGTAPSGIFHSMLTPIKRKGLAIIGWNDWFGSNYYTLHAAKPYPLDGHPDAIDLKEAEDWGRKMADHARRIYAGEKNLIPEIPHGPQADPLFQPHGVMGYFRRFEKPHRVINTTKCKYPSCTLCIDNCEAKSLDFSSKPPKFKIETCLNCALCDRMCPQGAIEINDKELNIMRTMKRIDMQKCKYPECTICVDHCSMNAIDFSVDPPVFKRSCDGDDLCWVICPEGAIEITNLDDTYRYDAPAKQGTAHQSISLVDQREAQGRFRRLVPAEKLGIYGPVMNIQRHPKFNINELMQETPLPPDYGEPYPENSK